MAALTAHDAHVPYRNSKLTQLMSDSLGGSAKTLMIVNVSPLASDASETRSSLDYALRVKQVKLWICFPLMSQSLLNGLGLNSKIYSNYHDEELVLGQYKATEQPLFASCCTSFGMAATIITCIWSWSIGTK